MFIYSLLDKWSPLYYTFIFLYVLTYLLYYKCLRYFPLYISFFQYFSLAVSQSVENCVCIMRNLSYHVHKEIPGAEKFQDPSALQGPGSAGTQRKKKDDAGCFGGKKAKGHYLILLHLIYVLYTSKTVLSTFISLSLDHQQPDSSISSRSMEGSRILAFTQHHKQQCSQKIGS